MKDEAIHERIERLVDEEHELWRRETDGDMDEATRVRLHELQVSLDQLWDLLRQRKALRRAAPRPGRGECARPGGRRELPPVGRRGPGRGARPSRPARPSHPCRAARRRREAAPATRHGPGRVSR